MSLFAIPILTAYYFPQPTCISISRAPISNYGEREVERIRRLGRQVQNSPLGYPHGGLKIHAKMLGDCWPDIAASIAQ